MSAQAEGDKLSKTPAEFLKSIKGKAVLVKLNSGIDYRGKRPAPPNPSLSSSFALGRFFAKSVEALKGSPRLRAGMLACLDGYMNIAMEQTEVRASTHHRLCSRTVSQAFVLL